MSTTTEKWTIFGERLKTELERQGMSLRQFSGKTGITLNTAFRYVHSQRIPRATEILKAAKVIGVTCDYMLGLSDDPHKTRDGWTKTAFCDMPSAQPETHEERTETHACDLIDRQAAIDAVEFGITYAKAINKSTGEVKELFKEGNKALNEAVERIKDLPSAQSEPSQAARDIATILENEKDMRVIKKNAESESCADTISRKAAIEAIMDADVCVTWNGVISDDDAVDIAIKSTKGSVISSIVNMPTAQPETHEERTETHACDCISRQAVIEINRSYHGQMPNEVNHRIWKEINELPSAQPEIIRCKECKHWNRESICDGFCSEDCMRHDEDFYCGYAERKTDE